MGSFGALTALEAGAAAPWRRPQPLGGDLGLSAQLGAQEEGGEAPWISTDVAWCPPLSCLRDLNLVWPVFPLQKLNEVGGKQSWGSGLAYLRSQQQTQGDRPADPQPPFLRVHTWPASRPCPRSRSTRPRPTPSPCFFTSVWAVYLLGRMTSEFYLRSLLEFFSCPWRKCPGPVLTFNWVVSLKAQAFV